MKDWTLDPIVVSKVKRVSARPDVSAWLNAPDRNRRERALLALAVAHTIAWQPKDKRPYGMLWLNVYEIDGGIGGKNGRSVQGYRRRRRLLRLRAGTHGAARTGARTVQAALSGGRKSQGAFGRRVLVAFAGTATESSVMRGSCRNIILRGGVNIKGVKY